MNQVYVQETYTVSIDGSLNTFVGKLEKAKRALKSKDCINLTVKAHNNGAGLITLVVVGARRETPEEERIRNAQDAAAVAYRERLELYKQLKQEFEGI